MSKAWYSRFQAHPTASDLVDLMGQFVISKQYGSLQYLLDSILRQAGPAKTPHQRIEALLRPTREFLDSPIISGSPEAMKLVVPFYVKLLARGIQHDIKADNAVDRAAEDLIGTATRHLNSGNSTLIDKAACIVAVFPMLLRACFALGDTGRFERWIDEIPELLFLMVRERRYDEFQQATGLLLALLDTLPECPELAKQVDSAIERFYTRYGSILEKLLRDAPADMLGERATNLLAPYREFAVSASKMKSEERLIDMIVAESQALRGKSELAMHLNSDLELFLRLSVDAGLPKAYEMALSTWRGVYREQTADDRPVFRLLSALKYIETKGLSARPQSEKLLSTFTAALDFLRNEPYAEFHPRFYSLCFYVAAFCHAKQLPPPQAFNDLLAGIVSRLEKTNESVVCERTRLLLREVAELAFPPGKFEEIWMLLTKR